MIVNDYDSTGFSVNANAFIVNGYQIIPPVSKDRIYTPVLFERAKSTFIDITSYHDFCEFLTATAGQQNYIPVTVSSSLEVVSTSADDAAAGTGTRTVGITYLDASGAWSEATVTMNGTTPVPVPITASAINYMYAKTGGSSEVSAGTINLRNASTPTIIYEQISANGNMSQSGRFTVPTGYYGRVNSVNCSVQSQNIEIKLRAKQNPFDSSLNSRWLFKAGFKLIADTSISIPIKGMYLPAGESIKISGITDNTGNARSHGFIDMELIQL